MGYKLNTIEAQEAWEDYREFLIGLQSVEQRHYIANNPSEKSREDSKMKVLQDAFKHGFAAGVDFKGLNDSEKEFQGFFDTSEIVIGAQEAKEEVAATLDVEVIKQPLKRKKTKYRNYRDPIQAKKETNEVVDLLQRVLFPVKLIHIIRHMRDNGHKHWNNKNASGFLVSAVRNGAPIKKVALGLYAYDASKENK